MTTFYTQSVDIISPGPHDALTFTTYDQTYTIAPNVLVASDPGYNAVSNSTWNASSLINYGSVFSPDRNGAMFNSNGAVVFNGASASIAGGYTGVYMNNNTNVGIDNRGSMIGYASVGVYWTPIPVVVLRAV